MTDNNMARELCNCALISGIVYGNAMPITREELNSGKSFGERAEIEKRIIEFLKKEPNLCYTFEELFVAASGDHTETDERGLPIDTKDDDRKKWKYVVDDMCEKDQLMSQARPTGLPFPEKIRYVWYLDKKKHKTIGVRLGPHR